MSNDPFCIIYITIIHGRMMFHNGNSQKRLEELSPEDIDQYLKHLTQQGIMARYAAMLREDYKVRTKV